MMHEEEKSSSYGLLGIVGSLSLHVLVLGVMGLSCIVSKPDEPPPFKEVEFFDVTPVDPAPAVETPLPPEVTPPEPEPPKPEPPKPEIPQPKLVEKPKPSHEDALRERLRNAKVTQPPQKPVKPSVNPEDIARRINRQITASRPAVVRHTGVPNLNNLDAAQQTAYENYLVSCLEPNMARLWEFCGPERLASVPRDAQVTLMISPNGSIISSYVSQGSDSARMNDCAQVLLEKLKTVKLPPFSQVHLQANASLRFVVNLKYQVQNH